MTDKVTAAPGGSMDPATGSRRAATERSRRKVRIALAASTAAVALVVGSATADAAGLTATGSTATGSTAPTTAAPLRVGSAARIPAGAVKTGTPSGSTPVQLSIGLNPRDPSELQAFATAVSTKGNPEYHHYLAKGQFASAFGPTQATIAEVTAALKKQGLHPGKVSSDGLSIPVNTTLAAAQHAFGTGFSSYRLTDGSTGYANTAAPQVAGNVAGDLSGITGLESLSRYQTQHSPLKTRGSATATTGRRNSAVRAQVTATGPQLCGDAVDSLGEQGLGTDGNGYYSAENLATTYGMQHTATSGSGVTIGVFEMENYSPSDLAAFQSCYGTNVQVTQDLVDGGPTLAPDPSQNIGLESLLDLEDIASLAPGASVIDYAGPDISLATEANWLDTYHAMVTDDRAQVLSISWGGCELDNDPSVMAAENNYSTEAAAQGQTMFAASGDNGASGCIQDTGSPNIDKASVNDPASQPFVTGVGGTTLSGEPATSRSTWNSNGGGTGGGVSSEWSMGATSYQAGFKGAGYSAACKPASGDTCRQVPDVSALADPYEGYAVYTDGIWGTIGGTSGATPTWASLVAIADSQPGCGTNGRLGFLNPTLYGAASLSRYSANFTDITSGSNIIADGVGYHAGTGYDLATGLGEPKAAALTQTLCGWGVAPATGPSQFHAVATPQRLLDTRYGIGWSGDGNVPADGTAAIKIEGNAGIPTSGVTSVVLNITVLHQGSSGWLTVYPDGATRPNTSNINWSTNAAHPNLVTVPVGGDGWIDLYNASGGSSAMFADVFGYYTNGTTAGGALFQPVTPKRVLDTRYKVGHTGPVAANGSVVIPVTGQANVPTDGTVTAVVMNVTVLHQQDGGWMAAYPTGTTTNTSNLNWNGNIATPNLVTVPVNPKTGQVTLTNHSNGTVDVFADVFGYYTTNGSGYHFNSVPNTQRLLDTRYNVGHKGKLAAGGSVNLAGIPSTAKAVVLNVTELHAAAGGWLTAWPAGTAEPNSSNINWNGAGTNPNAVIVQTGGTPASVSLGNSNQGPIDVFADLFGYFS